MLIREANSKDVENIARLYITNWKMTYRGLLPDEYLNHLDIPCAAEKWSSFLKKPDHHIFVACEDSLFCGFGACSPDPDIVDFVYDVDSGGSIYFSNVSDDNGVVRLALSINL